MVYSKNAYLTKEEMTVNATYLLNSFLSKGWTKESISGMLGNMETESTINPGIWQNLDSGNMNVGYGLVQWTPASKYILWAGERGYSITDIDGQIARILYEVEHGIQWISTSEYPMTFYQFTKSRETPEVLASVFLKNYERAGVEKEVERRSQARYWFDNLVGGGGGKPFFPTTEGLPITSPYGWRTHPTTGEMDFHGAIDIGGGGVNHPIYATQNGEVIQNFDNGTGGWTVRIKHSGDGYYSQYMHLAEQSPIPVGTHVLKGEEIGTMGTTGTSTGIHLDFAIALNNSSWYGEEGTIDPEIYLQMDFGSGGQQPPGSDKMKDFINLLLCDSISGWN